MEFFLDKDNYCCVKNTANPDEQVIGDFFEGDIQGSDYYVNFIIDIINQIKNDEIENWQGTGNAHTISITKDKIIADNGNKLLQNGFPCGWKGDYPEGKMIVI